jgi:hypothetical protein
MPLTAASRTSLLLRGQVVLEALYPATATIAGTAYPCAESTDAVEVEFDAGGRMITSRRIIRILKSALATAPAIGTRVTLDDGNVFRLVEADPGRNDIAWTLTLENPDR